MPNDLRKAASFDPVSGEVLPTITVDSLNNFKEIILHSDVLCLAPLLMFREETLSGKLAILPFHRPYMVTNYGFVYLKNRSLSPSAYAFMEILKKVEDGLLREEKKFIETISASLFEENS